MNDPDFRQKFIRRLGGYYLIPHELLHVLAYRLIGQPCRYEWGQPYVQSMAQMSRRERLFTSLFPFIVFFGLGWLLSLLAVTLAFFINKQPDQVGIPVWLVGMFVTSMVLVFYSSTAQGDLINSYHLLFPKDA